ncbi:TRAP transporter small permease subunit [Amorphus sp. 3PC139-8]|uniref:TRAP transporter small permease subunit n=1 Tax=Amorphus sp. 3PC139-8 TaxID=2735676 RepID=UPI00345CC344
MTAIFRAIDRLSDLSAVLAKILIVFIFAHILVEIAARNLFSTSTFVLDEFVGYSVAAATFLAAGATFKAGEFIRVGFLGELLNNRDRARAALEAACTLVTLAVVLMLARYFILNAIKHFERGVVSDTIAKTPLWVPEALVCFGLVMFALQLLSHLLQLPARLAQSK